MKKNDIVTLDIVSLTGGGDGIARSDDGMVIFVPNTAVGDTAEVIIIKVKKNYCIGKLKSIIKAAECRTESDCDVSKSCGGCVFRHISYEKELEIKRQQVSDSFLRIGKLDAVISNAVAALETNEYRNKAQIPIGIDREGKIICGYYAKQSHRIIPFSGCNLHKPVFNSIIDCFLDWANSNHISVYDERTGQGLLRHLYIRQGEVTKELMVGIVINGTELPFGDKLISDLKGLFGETLKSVMLNVNTEDTNVILSDKCTVLYGTDDITDEICKIKLNLSMLSFYQVNQPMAQRLYDTALKLADVEDKTVLDLYCGAGAIGLIAARKAKKVYGVEIVAPAVKDAIQNAQLNKTENIEFYCADAASAAEDFKRRSIRPDVVIVDPPRKGISTDLITTITKDFRPERVVYVSCNDSTLARDCAVFLKDGYTVKEVIPIDLFPRTGHIECVALLTNENGEKI